MDIYLTMTTIPERIKSDHFKKVIDSLHQQRKKVSKIIINLQTRTHNYEIPQWVKENKNIILNETDLDGPAAKLLGSLSIIPENSLVIVLDDDIIFRNNFTETLYRSYLRNPKSISSLWTVERKFTDITKNFKEPCGFAGYIFNINIMEKLTTKHVPDYCKFIDDTWFGWTYNQLGINIVEASDKKNTWDNILNIQKTDEHPEWYELCKDTDRKTLVKKALKKLEPFTDLEETNYTVLIIVVSIITLLLISSFLLLGSVP